MTRADEAKKWALEHVGCPYVYGATDKICTPKYRQARANQYPEYAEKIKNNCPRMSGKAVDCTECRWYDKETGKGKEAFDCAQFTRWCMNAVGIKLVSGANGQWKQTLWVEAGSIDTIPRNKLCLVYREDSDGKKHHAGVYLGDGWIVHAKGHDYGVVKELLGNPKFTHWGIPAGLYDESQQYPTVSKGSKNEYVKILQKALIGEGYVLKPTKTAADGCDGIFGADTETTLKAFQTKVGLVADGVCGPATWLELMKNVDSNPSDDSSDSDVADDIDMPDISDSPSESLDVLAEDITKVYKYIKATYDIISKYIIE